MMRLVRRARRIARDWSLRLARRVTPVLRVRAPLQLAAAVGLLVRSRFATRHDGDEPKPRIPKRFPPLFLVFDAQAARRVLSDREFFDVELYDAKMRKAIGRFFLGLDYDDPEYKAQLALWHDIARGAHAARVESEAIAAARATPMGDGGVDVVDWTGRTLDAFTDSYFGIPPIPSRNGHGGSALLDLFRRTSSFVFNIDLASGHLADDAAAAGREIQAHLLSVIAAKRAGKASHPGCVIDDIMAGPGKTITDEQLAAVLAGVLSGMYVPTSSQFIGAVDYLLDLSPRELDKLRAAARLRAGPADVSSDHHESLITRYVLESARFDPFPPGLIRHAARSTSLDTARGRSKSVPAGATVVAMMNAVALDPLIAPRPGTFSIGRPPGHSLLFGSGQHHCFAATAQWPVAPALMTAMATSLFSQANLRRAPGRAGTVRSRGSWPASFRLLYDDATPTEHAAS